MTIQREALVDLIISHLTATYHCTRVWEAWHVGTMTEDDFESAAESNLPDELADAILALVNAIPQASTWAPQPAKPIPEGGNPMCEGSK